MNVLQTIPADLERNVVVLRPASKPKDRRLPFFVVVSFPSQEKLNVTDFERLQTRYTGRLQVIPTGDGRWCIKLPCLNDAHTLEEVGKRADKLKRNIIQFLGIQPSEMSCGYSHLCQVIGQPCTLHQQAVA